jgi:predicted RNA-binding Zn-ribbon protein involved in translation (DUF1610 family)
MFTPKSEEIKSFYLENQKIEKIKITNPSEIENITEVQKSIKLFTKIDFEKDKKRTIIIEISQFLFGLLCFAIVLIFGPEDGELTGNFFMIVLFILGAYFSVIKWIYKLINSQNHSFKKIAREQEKWFTSIECQNCHQTDAINLGYYEITCPECQVGFKMIAPQQNSTSNFTPEKTAETSLDNFSQKILSGEQTCVTCKKQITIPEKTIVYNCSHCLTENRISNSTLKTLSQKLSK